MVSDNFPWFSLWKVTLSGKVSYQYLEVAVVELVLVMEDLYFELYEEGEHSKLDDREYLRIFMQRTLKGLNMYVTASSSQIKRLENSLPSSWKANMEKGVVVSLSMKEIKLESLCFQKH